jgi:hypothetical protein
MEKEKLQELFCKQKTYIGYSKLLEKAGGKRTQNFVPRKLSNSAPNIAVQGRNLLMSYLKQGHEFSLFCEVLNTKVIQVSKQLAGVMETHNSKIDLLLNKNKLCQRKQNAVLNKIKHNQRLKKQISENADLADLEDKLAGKIKN